MINMIRESLRLTIIGYVILLGARWVGQAVDVTSWRRVNLRDARGKSGMEERSITRRHADARLSVSEDPVMRQGGRRSPSAFA